MYEVQKGMLWVLAVLVFGFLVVTMVMLGVGL
jgi:hypothetical protein